MKRTNIACFSAILFFAGISFAHSFQEEQALVIAFNDTISKPWKWFVVNDHPRKGWLGFPATGCGHRLARQKRVSLALTSSPPGF